MRMKSALEALMKSLDAALAIRGSVRFRSVLFGQAARSPREGVEPSP